MVPAPEAPASAKDEPPPRRDPLLAALPPNAKKSIVFEAAAIKDSPIGRLFLRCAFHDGEGDKLGELKTRYGFDPMNDLDRVAMSDGVEIVTGRFGAVDWGGLFGGDAAAAQHAYGSTGTIYETGGGDDAGSSRQVFGTWGDGMLLLGENEDAVRRAIDRMEGRAPEAPPPIREGDTYGEVYGVMSGDALSGIFGGDLDAKLSQAAQRIELHVDTRDAHDVLMVADVGGPDGPSVDDLGRSLGGAMALGKVKARAEGDDDLQELLDVSRVVPHDGTFRIEVALPLDLVQRKLCPDAGVRP
jgi:hypothetical protein